MSNDGERPGRKRPISISEEQAKILQKASPELNRQVGGDFTRVSTSERRTLLLRGVPHGRQPSTLWTRDRKLVKRFFVRRYLEYQGQFECEFTDRASRILGEVDRELDLAGNNEIYFNLRCEESTLFFQITRREISSRNGLLLIKIPKDIYEVQRRAQLRYRTMEGDSFQFRSEQLAPWQDYLRILDISSGGIGVSIAFPNEESAARFNLEAEQRIQSHLDLGVLSISAPGEIRYVRRDPDPATGLPTARVGVRLVGLSQENVESIQLFVMDRSYARIRDLFTD